LFYIVGTETADAVMGVKVQTEPTFKKNTPEELFRGTYIGFAPTNDIPWDIHPEGNRFLMMKTTAAVDAAKVGQKPRINIVLNWDEELKQRVPVD
jgi:hypothetical protein